MEAPIKEDATKVWLRKNENYTNNRKKYLSIFNNYYDTKIKEENFLDAAKILDVVGTKLSYHYDYDSAFLNTINNFNKKYRHNVPALKTTFVDSYLANYYYDKGDFKKSCNYFKNITLLEPNDYKSCYEIARAYYELSYVYFGMGKQNLSLEANQKSLEYFNKIGDIDGLGSVYSNYANIYKAIGDKKRAIENADKAIKAFKSIDNIYDTYMGLYNKISVYDYVQDSRKTPLIDSTYQAFKASKYESDILKIAIYDFKVENLLRENKLIEAKEILDELKPIVEKVDSDNWMQDYKATLVQYEIKNNPNHSNIEAIKKAIPILKDNEQYEKADLFYSVLKKHAIQNNDFKNALKYEEEKQIIGDSLGNIATRGKIVELETIYQTEKKEQEIALQKTTILNKNTTIALLASLFLGLFLTVVIYITRQKQKKLRLEKQNAQVYTKQLLEKTEEERKRIASDLHDSVSHELLGLKNLFEEKNDITNNKIDSIINDIRIISRNLHPIMFDKIGLKSSIEQLVERAQSVNDFMVTADIDYNNSLSTNDELQVYRIIQEALSNIIKYANAVAAKITVLEKNNIIYIEIKDNGIGFNVSETLNGSNAFGLHNIIERSRVIGGQAKIVSDKNGTIITIEIKKT
ncbi:ATP-binding protein [Flavobacterium sp.]|uniref:tetratricopeptide repeat-containing sensor histidine kinase n=1 Tax=Flavobacterium sp. TaxID=239 RepID=UPI0038FCD1E1